MFVNINKNTMTDLKETVEEVKEYIVARLKVPIFFYYLLALAIWNWDIILLILKSKFEVESIIWFIKTNYSGHDRLWKPFLVAVGSSILFPAVMVGLDWFLKFVNKERIKSAKQVAEAEAEAQYDVQVKRNKTDKLADLNRIIENNKIELSEKNEVIKQLDDSNKKFSDLINDNTKKIQEIEINNNELLNEVKFLERLEDIKYDITDRDTVLKEINYFITSISNLNLLINTLDEILNRRFTLDVEGTAEIIRKLLQNEFIYQGNDELDGNEYRLSKTGFSLYFYITGIQKTEEIKAKEILKKDDEIIKLSKSIDIINSSKNKTKIELIKQFNKIDQDTLSSYLFILSNLYLGSDIADFPKQFVEQEKEQFKFLINKKLIEQVLNFDNEYKFFLTKLGSEIYQEIKKINN